MKLFDESGKNYFKKLEERSKKSRIHRDYQFIGLEIANLLDDLKHKALYIKLAKTGNSVTLLNIAKTVADNPQIKNRGAYFMRLLQKSNQKQ